MQASWLVRVASPPSIASRNSNSRAWIFVAAIESTSRSFCDVIASADSRPTQISRRRAWSSLYFSSLSLTRSFRCSRRRRASSTST